MNSIYSGQELFSTNVCRMEQRTLKNVNNGLKTNIYSNLETLVVKVITYI